MSNTQLTNHKIRYSKILSALFSSNAIIALSILCLLNNLSLDLYTVGTLLKIVVPASFCFWIIGYVIGTILDRYNSKITRTKEENEKLAYEIPSIFADHTQSTNVEEVTNGDINEQNGQ